MLGNCHGFMWMLFEQGPSDKWKISFCGGHDLYRRAEFDVRVLVRCRKCWLR